MKSPRRRTATLAATGLALALAAPLAGTTSSVTAAEPSRADRAGQTSRAAVQDADSLAMQRDVRTAAVMDHLRNLETIGARYGSRAAGEVGYDAAARYIEHELREAGYTPRRQYFEFPYTRVDAAEFRVDGQPVEHLPMTNSPSSPEGGTTAALVQPAVVTGCEASDYDGVDVAGQIALVSRGICAFAQKSQVAGAAGAAGVVIYNNAPGALNGTLGEDVEGTVPTTGISQEDGAALVAGLPSEGFLDLDILAETRRTYNIIAETGRGRTDNVVMLGAHLDGVQEATAINDNGSGSAGILEVALQLKKHERKLRNRVRFAWWGAEELGLLGSNHWVNSLVESNPAALDDIATYLNFDMIGSPNWIVGVYDADESGGPASAPVTAGSIETEQAFRRYFRSTRQPAVDTEFSGRSDYQAFLLNGVAAGGLFTGADGEKTAQEARLFGGTEGILYDPNYHTAADDISNVRWKPLTIMTDAIAHMTITLGKSTAQIDVPQSDAARKQTVRPHSDAVRR